MSTKRRHRALKALALELDDSLGADRSSLIFSLDDGWTIKKIARLEDQLREGELMANCLRKVKTPDQNCYSLRDADNLPHASFAAWACESPSPADRRDRVIETGCVVTAPNWLAASHALIYFGRGRANSILKPEYVERLRRFGSNRKITAAFLRAWPTDERELSREIFEGVWPDGEPDTDVVVWPALQDAIDETLALLEECERYQSVQSAEREIWRFR